MGLSHVHSCKFLENLWINMDIRALMVVIQSWLPSNTLLCYKISFRFFQWFRQILFADFGGNAFSTYVSHGVPIKSIQSWSNFHPFLVSLYVKLSIYVNFLGVWNHPCLEVLRGFWGHSQAENHPSSLHVHIRGWASYIALVLWITLLALSTLLIFYQQSKWRLSMVKKNLERKGHGWHDMTWHCLQRYKEQCCCV